MVTQKFEHKYTTELLFKVTVKENPNVYQLMNEQNTEYLQESTTLPKKGMKC